MCFYEFSHGGIREGKEEAVVQKGRNTGYCRVGGKTGRITVNQIVGIKTGSVLSTEDKFPPEHLT